MAEPDQDRDQDRHRRRRRRVSTPVLAVAAVAVVVLSLVVGGSGGFAGTDTTALEHVAVLAPHYRAWAEPLFAPDSAEVEAGLFALQAAAGALVVGFVLGWYAGRRRSR